MFEKGKKSLVGIGARDGMPFYTDTQVMAMREKTLRLDGLIVYLYDTGSKKPVPWNAYTLKYPVTKVKKAVHQNRFIKKVTK